MISAIWRALVLGVSVAAPIGPVNLAVIRTGLVRGAKSAWLVGMGAAVVDTVYLLLTYVGVTPLLLRIPWVPPVLGLAGSFILARMAWCALAAARKAEADEIVPVREEGLPSGGARGGGARGGGGRGGGGRGGGARSFLEGMAITAANPVTIAFWITVGSGFVAAYLQAMRPWQAIVVLGAAGVGSALWFSLLALALATARAFIMKHLLILRVVNVMSAVLLGYFALALAMRILAIR